MENNEIIKKMDAQLQTFKNFRGYVDLLEKEIKRNGFLMLDEKSYRKNIREYSVKKSDLVANFSNKDNLSLWLASTTEQNRNIIYDLVHSKSLEITDKDFQILDKKEKVLPHGYNTPEPEYKINNNYNDINLKYVMDKIKDTCSVTGKIHLEVQERAHATIKKSTDDYNSYQKTCDILYEKFGPKYDEFLSELKVAISQKEITQVGEDFIFTSKIHGKPQQLKISVDEAQKISAVSTIAPTIDMINSKFRTQDLSTEKLKI